MTPQHAALVVVEHPRPRVRRLVLNRPEKRNALHGPLRSALLAALAEADADPEVGVVVVSGAGPDFCAGYDLDPRGDEVKYAAAGSGPGRFQREVVEGWLSIADLSVPVIAQVHGHCLAGGSELAASCDLVYVAADARVGYPAVRFGVPDLQYHAWLLGLRRAMEQVLTGDVMIGDEAVAAGFANRAFAGDRLADETLRVAERIATVPDEITALNKRTVHRAMGAMGMHSSVRSGTDSSALAARTDAFTAFMSAAEGGGVRTALDRRDTPFGDGRTRAEPDREDQP
ncbi:enoyl-CoA hydratase-related protein [Nocardioides sp. YIM 152315]|uniref:enoyl-CoA hydratase-related protein n=1 Tax=Nocardioides sp. YIM 152315 TaxID=3031760 RepID=UPI0023D9D57D|nr:enoyl-CoA hydratase-related protein [Nocardioides sp. YIM 152315]MDF1604727.1 enoyl-CoA hydratase-related protein [Nocardioides sp. YIM 152315]